MLGVILGLVSPVLAVGLLASVGGLRRRSRMPPARDDGRGGGELSPVGELVTLALPGSVVNGRSASVKSEKSGIEEDAREKPISMAASEGTLRWNWCDRDWVNGDTGEPIVLGVGAETTVVGDSGANTGESVVLTETGDAAKSSMRSTA